MFGYIRAERAELRIREYEYYRAAYCGLCRSMGKCTGQCSRLTLSYDIAFLAHVRMLLEGTVPAFKARRCCVHPVHKRRMMEPNPQLSYCAHASAILAYEKCRDDVADERGFARLGARMKCLFLRGAYKKARRAYPALADRVREKLVQLSEREAARTTSADEVAAIFGELLGEVTAHGLEESAARIARRIGFEAGRFIYFLDALDDLEKDAKRGRFNPFLLRYGGAVPEEDKGGLRDALVMGLCDLESAIDLIPSREDPTSRDILNNILYLGMPRQMDDVLCGRRRKKEDAREQQSL